MPEVLMRRTCVQIDFMRLSDRLARTWGRSPMRDEVEQWLVEQGFTRSSGKGWYCDGEKIECLQPGEIVREIMLETNDGITMVGMPPPSNAEGNSAQAPGNQQ
jgi:hypothetical protein